VSRTRSAPGASAVGGARSGGEAAVRPRAAGTSSGGGGGGGGGGGQGGGGGGGGKPIGAMFGKMKSWVEDAAAKMKKPERASHQKEMRSKYDKDGW